jgi:hypothetical protein
LTTNFLEIIIGHMEESNAIPRLYRLGDLEVSLIEISRGASFERIRQALIDFVRRTGEGRTSMVPRLGDDYSFWSPAQETLSELMKLGLVDPAPLPASRQYVDSHRADTYQLTGKGMDGVTQLSGGDGAARARFLDMLTVSLMEAHHGFASLLSAATRHPLCIPEYSIEKITALIEGGRATGRLADDALARLTSHWPPGREKPSAKELAAWIQKAVDRRFPKDRVRRPSQKDIVDIVDDAVLGFASKAYDIHLDAISFNVCMSWAEQLAILEESRYVVGWPGRTVWATAEIQNGNVLRPSLGALGDSVAGGLGDGFRMVADSVSQARSSGSLPIYRVRAQAAFMARVNLRFVDIILRRILSGELKAPYEVQVALGRGTPPPRSEPVFVSDGRRFFDIMIIEKEEL